MSAPKRLRHMSMNMDPLEPPGYPSGYGYVAGRSIGSGTERPDINPIEPESLSRTLQSLAPQEGALPDIVRVQFGPVDKQLIGQLLASVAGEDSGLVGVPSTFAAKRLSELGLPQAFSDWTPAQWDQKIAELTLQYSPATVVNF